MNHSMPGSAFSVHSAALVTIPYDRKSALFRRDSSSFFKNNMIGSGCTEKHPGCRKVEDNFALPRNYYLFLIQAMKGIFLVNGKPLHQPGKLCGGQAARFLFRTRPLKLSGLQAFIVQKKPIPFPRNPLILFILRPQNRNRLF